MWSGEKLEGATDTFSCVESSLSVNVSSCMYTSVYNSIHTNSSRHNSIHVEYVHNEGVLYAYVTLVCWLIPFLQQGSHVFRSEVQIHNSPLKTRCFQLFVCDR